VILIRRDWCASEIVLFSEGRNEIAADPHKCVASDLVSWNLTIIGIMPSPYYLERSRSRVGWN
jgi:hypothetical protein